MTSVIAVWVFAAGLLSLWTGALAIGERALAMAAPETWPLHERLVLAGANHVIGIGPAAALLGPAIVTAAGALRHRRGLAVRSERRLLLAWLLTSVAASAGSLAAAWPSAALVLTLAAGVELAGVAACTAVAAHLQSRLPSPHATRRAWIVAVATLLLAAGPIECLWLIPPAYVWLSSGRDHTSG